MLVFIPQCLAGLAFAAPFLLAQELPSDAEGHALGVDAAVRLLLGFFLVLIVLPVACYLIALVLGQRGSRGELVTASLGFGLACFMVSFIVSSTLAQEFWTVWLATNIVAAIALRNHQPFVSDIETV